MSFFSFKCRLIQVFLMLNLCMQCQNSFVLKNQSDGQIWLQPTITLWTREACAYTNHRYNYNDYLLFSRYIYKAIMQYYFQVDLTKVSYKKTCIYSCLILLVVQIYTMISCRATTSKLLQIHRSIIFSVGQVHAQIFTMHAYVYI